VKAAGLKADGVDLDAFALVRALAVDTEEEDPRARVFCHLGGVTNLAVAVGTNCFFTRPLSAVWDEEEAGSRLADEIRLSIDYYMTQPQAKPVGEVVLSGPGSADGQLVESLETHLGIPVQVPAPLGVLDGSELAPTEDPHRYTVAAGLSLGAAA
jgi:Tfp pilus assembly PilM family ATPase